MRPFGPAEDADSAAVNAQVRRQLRALAARAVRRQPGANQVETFTPTSLFKTCPLTLRQGERVSKPQLAETLYASLQSEFVNKGAGSK